MLSVKMTPHLLGIEVTGDYDELNRLYDAVWVLVGTDDEFEPRPNVQEAVIRDRLLALCYDLRHAYMGDRNVRMQENGMDRERAEWHGISLPPLNNLYYSVEILYPEAMFEVMMLGHLLYERRAQLVKKRCFSAYDADDPRVVFDEPCATVSLYQSLVLEAVRDVVSANSFSRIRKQVGEGFWRIADVYTQWIDAINIDWCGYTEKKRRSSLSTVVRDISDCWNVQKYLNIVAEIDAYAKSVGTDRFSVRLADDYPEEYDW